MTQQKRQPRKKLTIFVVFIVLYVLGVLQKYVIDWENYNYTIHLSRKLISHKRDGRIDHKTEHNYGNH